MKKKAPFLFKMSFRKNKQCKGTKMSLAEFQKQSETKKEEIKVQNTVTFRPQQEKQVFSFNDILLSETKKKESEEKEKEEILIDSNDKNVTAMKNNRRPNFKKGKKIDVSFETQINDFFESVPLVNSDEFDLRSLKLQKLKEEKELETEYENIRTQNDFDRTFFLNKEKGIFNPKFYRDYIELRDLKSKDLTQYRSIGEMGFLLAGAPELIRNNAMKRILDYDITVVSEIGEKNTLHKETDRRSVLWSKVMNANNAYFKMSKNGKTIFCDFRGLYRNNLCSEVQMCNFNEKGNIEGDFYIVDVDKCPEFINNFLK